MEEQEMLLRVRTVLQRAGVRGEDAAEGHGV